jgi:hypothetical protein
VTAARRAAGVVVLAMVVERDPLVTRSVSSTIRSTLNRSRTLRSPASPIWRRSAGSFSNRTIAAAMAS